MSLNCLPPSRGRAAARPRSQFLAPSGDKSSTHQSLRMEEIIMPGPRFFETRMGATFYEGTVPRIARALADIAVEVKRYNDNAAQVPRDFRGVELPPHLTGESNPPYDPVWTTGPELDATNPDHDLVHGAFVSVCGALFEVAVHRGCCGTEEGTTFLVLPDDFGDVGYVYCPVCGTQVTASLLKEE